MQACDENAQGGEEREKIAGDVLGGGGAGSEETEEENGKRAWRNRGMLKKLASGWVEMKGEEVSLSHCISIVRIV